MQILLGCFGVHPSTMHHELVQPCIEQADHDNGVLGSEEITA